MELNKYHKATIMLISKRIKGINNKDSFIKAMKDIEDTANTALGAFKDV